MRENSKRQLIALMFSDVVGYASLTTDNEARALQLLDEYRAIFRRAVPLYGGRENKTIGDAFFIEFGSALEAVLCAIEIQTSLYERNLTVPQAERIQARIGIHLGDVVLSDNDSFGEGVNVAARIEAYAEPGGICVSRQVADQLQPYEKIDLVRVGKRSLKHIRTAAELFKVRLPWERVSTFGALLGQRFERLSSAIDREPSGNALLYGLTLALVGLFCYLTATTAKDMRRVLSGDRSPASPASARLELDDNWEAAPISGKAPESESEVSWHKFVKYDRTLTDAMADSYWLRKTFTTTEEWKNPALVLGPISGAHRVFLNGRFIGGSESVFTLAYYSFDPRMLEHGGKPNALLVKVDPKRSLTPGVVHLPSVGSFIGEFGDVYRTVVWNEFYFHVVQTLYLALVFLSFVGCLLVYFFNVQDKKYLYFAVYLLLGTMSLLHSNGIVCAFLDFRLQRAFRLFGLSLSSVVLLSTYFHLIQARRAELLNNFLGLAWLAVLFVALIVPHDSPIAYLAKWNWVLGVTLIYSAAWILTTLNYRMIRLFTDTNHWRAQFFRMRYESLLVGFGILTAMLALSSMKAPFLRFLPKTLLSWFFTLGTTYPFFFAAGILTLGLFDYIFKVRAIRHGRRADDLVLGISEVLRRSAPGDGMIQVIQERLSEFVEAERSTVYLWEGGVEPALLAHSIVGTNENRRLVSAKVAAHQGILGYVCQTQRPLLVHDLGADFRLRPYVRGEQTRDARSYKTGSCMLFPLVIDQRTIGVLTFADKRGNRRFNRHDFTLLHGIAKDLAMVIHARNLARAVG